MKMDAPELKKTVNISFALLLSLIVAAFLLGGIATGILGLNDKMDEYYHELKTEIQEVKESTNSRMDRKAKNHERIYHSKK